LNIELILTYFRKKARINYIIKVITRYIIAHKAIFIFVNYY